MKIALVFFLVLMLIGCVSAPSVQPVPDALLEAPSVEKQTITRAMPFWWLSLQDETLTELIEIGLRESPTTQIALARLAQAKTGIDIAEANALPSLLGLGLSLIIVALRRYNNFCAISVNSLIEISGNKSRFCVGFGK